MSINLGEAAHKALENLRQNPDWFIVRAALGELVAKKLDEVLASPIEVRVDYTGYVRALRDVFVALEAATTVVQQRAVPTPRARRAAPVEVPATDDKDGLL